jgi:multidrug resistance efflux pump
MSAERVAFLEQQLALAVAHLREKDATEEACAVKFEALYAERYATLQKAHEQVKQQYKAAEKAMGEYARRYALIRQHMVRVKALDVLANGNLLDHMLDKITSSVNKGPLQCQNG